MICKDCGAEIKPGMRKCPFCGADVYEESLKEHENEVNEIHKKTGFWKSLPDRLAQKGMKGAAIAILALIIIGLVGVLVATIAGHISSKAQYANRSKQLTQLEALYDAGDYEGIYTYYMEECSDRSGDSYSIYREISRLQMYYDFVTEDLDTAVAQAEQYEKASFLSQVAYSMNLLSDCQEIADLDYPYDEEDVVDYYRSAMDAILVDRFCLTEEEIADLLEQYQENGDSETYEEAFAETVYNTYMERK